MPLDVTQMYSYAKKIIKNDIEESSFEADCQEGKLDYLKVKSWQEILDAVKETKPQNILTEWLKKRLIEYLQNNIIPVYNGIQSIWQYLDVNESNDISQRNLKQLLKELCKSVFGKELEDKDITRGAGSDAHFFLDMLEMSLEKLNVHPVLWFKFKTESSKPIIALEYYNLKSLGYSNEA